MPIVEKALVAENAHEVVMHKSALVALRGSIEDIARRIVGHGLIKHGRMRQRPATDVGGAKLPGCTGQGVRRVWVMR